MSLQTLQNICIASRIYLRNNNTITIKLYISLTRLTSISFYSRKCCHNIKLICMLLSFVWSTLKKEKKKKIVSRQVTCKNFKLLCHQFSSRKIYAFSQTCGLLRKQISRELDFVKKGKNILPKNEKLTGFYKQMSLVEFSKKYYSKTSFQ